jgi:rubredoxin---NAD+ reductase
LPPTRDCIGEWHRTESDADGEKHLFIDDGGVVRGYVLTRGKTEQRTEMDTRVGELA